MLNNQEISVPVLIKDLGMLYATYKSKNKVRFGFYRCSCGKEFKTITGSIKSGATKSCGCYQKQRASSSNTKHGMSLHPIYSVWKDMVGRCKNENNNNFSYYGGRGISVCNRWLNVENFIEDMYQTYKEGLEIDRRDNDGNYEPSNCRWVTGSTQQRNTRKIYSHNKSGYRGVHARKNTKKWMSQIVVNKKRIIIGSFNDPKVAAMAYDTYVIVYGLEHTTNFHKGIFENNTRKQNVFTKNLRAI